MKRYLSRTYWLVWGLVGIATWLTYAGNIDGQGWITIALGLFAGWQTRRWADNKLAAKTKAS